MKIPFRHSATPSIKADVLTSISLSIEQVNSNDLLNNWLPFKVGLLSEKFFNKFPEIKICENTNQNLNQITQNLQLDDPVFKKKK